jgi:hypothetical protein
MVISLFHDIGVSNTHLYLDIPFGVGRDFDARVVTNRVLHDLYSRNSSLKRHLSITSN